MNDRLESWKEIAVYLGRGVRTVRRWERREGLPVRRHFHGQRATVFAFPSEIDAWLADRGSKVAENWRLGSFASLLRNRKLLGGTAITAGLFLLIGSPARMKPDWFSSRVSAPQPLTKLSITLPATTVLKRTGTIGLAISPDGRGIVYVGEKGRSSQLYLRRLDEAEAQPILGTEGAAAGLHFFSPDGQSLGFYADGKLKRVSLDGGPQVTVCAAGSRWRGGSWNSLDMMVFSAYPNRSSRSANLYRVSAAGGQPETLATPDSEKSERDYSSPKFLPGGKALLFDVTRQGKPVQIRVLSLETGEQKVVVDDGFNAYYAPTGHLVYQRRSTLLAAPFDLGRLEMTGNAVPILKGIRRFDYALAVDGTLVYVPGGGPTFSLVWVDREGREQLFTEEKRNYFHPRISPDGKQVAIKVLEDQSTQIWIYNFEGDSFRLLRDEGTWRSAPVWTPDGQWITFASSRKVDGSFDLYRKRVDGSSRLEHLATRQFPSFPFSWSPDGKALVLEEDPSGNLDISLLLDEEGATPRPFLSSPKREWGPRFSPDGRWIAYFSDETGSRNLYVCAYPKTEDRWLVLGHQDQRRPRVVWSPDGSELFHYDNGQMMAVSVQMQPHFKASKPRVLFEGLYRGTFDISPDGQRFLMVKEVEQSPIHVVLNWFEELERLVPLDDL